MIPSKRIESRKERVLCVILMCCSDSVIERLVMTVVISNFSANLLILVLTPIALNLSFADVNYSLILKIFNFPSDG
ncbi:hypothetical protein L596_007308 [Steinernema carpocapsae]|uniref:Uncharacterized protein n=1 Tax=Steinernema carpocapsae TaxID=34508 RepID=A0A4U5P8V4_STECR|nr:hypothetical protein L596_007308 [Steinernema carpocapsae]